MIVNSDSSDLSQIWHPILGQLQMQMTQATFDTWLSGSRLVAMNGSGWIIAAGSEQAAEWLDNRLRATIERTVKALGHDVPLRFVAAAALSNSDRLPEPGPGLQPEPVSESQPAPANAALDLAHFDHSKKFFSKHPQYISLFYSAYLGPATLAVWQFIRDQHGRSSDIWTGPADYEIKALMDGVGISRQKLMGVPRGCPLFDAHLLETGQPLAECCPRPYVPMADPDGWPHRTRPLPDWPEGRPTCRHWVPGALEILEAEGLAVYRKTGRTRGALIRIQVYQYPPFLTPRQVGRLKPRAQIEHAGFLRRLGVDVAEWRGFGAYSLQAVWMDRTGLELTPREVGVLCADARNLFFFPSICDQMATDGDICTPGGESGDADGGALRADEDT